MGSQLDLNHSGIWNKYIFTKKKLQVKVRVLQCKNLIIKSIYWRGGRVVECGALEMRYAFVGIGGSNPPLSVVKI